MPEVLAYSVSNSEISRAKSSKMSWRVASSQPKLISATVLASVDQFRRIFVEARGIAQRVFQERMEHELSRVLTIGAKYRAYAGERE